MQTPQKGIVRETRCPHENYCAVREVTIREQGSEELQALSNKFIYSGATNKVRSTHIAYR